jgi:predicted DNA binding CopG/RHH family protein
MEKPSLVSRGTHQGPCYTARSTTTCSPRRLTKNNTVRSGHLSQPAPSNQLLGLWIVRGFHDTKEPGTNNFGKGYEPKGEEGIREFMKKIPKFSNEAEEQKFWKEADSTEYIDWSKAKRIVFTNLKPSLKTISIRLPESMIEELKVLANKRDVPYQSLLKIFLGERIEEELKTSLLRRAKA